MRVRFASLGWGLMEGVAEEWPLEASCLDDFFSLSLRFLPFPAGSFSSELWICDVRNRKMRRQMEERKKATQRQQGLPSS